MTSILTVTNYTVVSVTAEGEIWLGRKLPAGKLAAKLKEHRDSYVNEEDFAFIDQYGLQILIKHLPGQPERLRQRRLDRCM